MQINKKNQKPIEYDAQFRYICPNINCGFDHWLSLKQCQTKNFKVVCDCGKIFKPKRISNIQIKYLKTKKKESQSKIDTITQTNDTTTVNTEKIQDDSEDIVIPEYLEKTSIKLLCNFGFTDSEAVKLVNKAFKINPIDNVAIFVRYIIENITTLEHN